MITVRRVLAALSRKPAAWSVLKPGDTLVLRYEHPFTPAAAAEIRERVKRAAPGIGLVVVDADDMAVIEAQATGLRGFGFRPVD